MLKTIIETKRIILRQFVLDDAPAVLEFGSNPEVNRYTGDLMIHQLEEAQKIITDTWFEDYRKYGYGRFAMVHKEDNRVIGFAGLKYEPELEATDIGYRILPEYWGQGLTSEVVIPILRYGFEDLGLKRIIGLVMLENPASSRVLEKSGLKFYKKAPYPGEPTIVNWYAIDREKFNP